MKVVINVGPGFFGLSEQAMNELGWTKDQLFRLEYTNAERADSKLVDVVERLGAAASAESSDLRIVEIPDGVKFHIYAARGEGGEETIHEDHRIWCYEGERLDD